MSLVVFLLGHTGRNIFSGHGKEDVVVQSQVRETMACLVAPVHQGFVLQRVCYTHQHIHHLRPAQLRTQVHEQASRRTFSIERNHASFVSRIDSLVFRKRVTTDSCWASETTSIWLVIPRVLVISHASVKYFSAVHGGIAMINKVLWQCYNVGVEITEISSVLNDAN